MVTPSDDITKLKNRKVCSGCIGEDYLKQQISATGKRRRCTYCRKTSATIDFDELSQRVSAAFEGHYQRTSNEPTSFEYTMMSDKESSYSWERKGDPVVDAIGMALECNEEIARDVQAILEDENAPAPGDYIGEEQEFDSDSYYARIPPQDHVWQREWNEFERSLKTESRYFSQSASAHLGKVFHGLEAMRTSDGRNAIVPAGPGTDTTAFYRARVFESWAALETAIAEPEKHIGPPPSLLARSGRMNAQGIAVFYGSSDPEAALAEVRPPVGSDVVVARFVLQRAVRLLDLRTLTDVHEDGSIFDDTLAWRRERAVFFKRLTRRITMPVMPSDEASGYLATQAIADFLASDERTIVDGILFPSAQVKGPLNVVLFQKASRVAKVELPAKTKVVVSSGQWEGEDEYVTDLRVIEEVPTRTPRKKPDDDWPANPFRLTWDDDRRPVTLAVDLDAIEVRHVSGVSFQTSSERVKRERVKREPMPRKPPF